MTFTGPDNAESRVERPPASGTAAAPAEFDRFPGAIPINYAERASTIAKLDLPADHHLLAAFNQSAGMSPAIKGFAQGRQLVEGTPLLEKHHPPLKLSA